MAFMLGIIVHLHDMRMFQLGDDLRLALETCQKITIIFKSRVHHFDGNVAIQFGMISLIDRRHAPLPKLPYDLIRPQRLTFIQRHARFLHLEPPNITIIIAERMCAWL
jgi:hypothetical protein